MLKRLAFALALSLGCAGELPPQPPNTEVQVMLVSEDQKFVTVFCGGEDQARSLQPADSGLLLDNRFADACAWNQVHIFWLYITPGFERTLDLRYYGTPLTPQEIKVTGPEDEEGLRLVTVTVALESPL